MVRRHVIPVAGNVTEVCGYLQPVRTPDTRATDVCLAALGRTVDHRVADGVADARLLVTIGELLGGEPG